MTLTSTPGQGANPPTLRLHFDRFPGFVEEYRALISLGGMFLKTQELHPVGSQVAFDLRLSDGFRLVHGSGEVAWVRTAALGPDQEAGLAVRFQALDEKGRELVLKILEEQVKGGGTPFDVDEVPAGVVATPGQPAPAPAVAAEPSGEALEFSTPWESLPEVPMDVLDEGSDLGAPPAAAPTVAAPAAAPAEVGFELPALSPPTPASPEVGSLEPPEIAFDAVDFDADPLDADDDEPTFVGSAVDLVPQAEGEPPAASGLAATDSAFETGAFDGSGLSAPDVPLSDSSLETGAYDGSALASPSFDDGPTFELEPDPGAGEALGLSDPPGIPDFGQAPGAEAAVVDVRDTTRERTPVDPMPTADEDTGEIDFGATETPVPPPAEAAWAPPVESPALAPDSAPSGVGFGGEGGFAPDAMAPDSAFASAEGFGDSGDSAVDPSTFGGGAGAAFAPDPAPGAAFQATEPPAATFDAASFDAASVDAAAPGAGFDPVPPPSAPTDSSFDPMAVPAASAPAAEPSFGSPTFDATPQPAIPEPAAAVPAGFDPGAPTKGGLFDNPSPSGGLFGGSPGESTEVLAEGAAPLAPTMAPVEIPGEPVAESTLSLDPPAHDDRYGFADYEDDLDGSAPKKGRGPVLRLALIGLLVAAVVGGYFFKDTLMGLVGLGESASSGVVANNAGQRPGPRPGADSSPTATSPAASGTETATDPTTGDPGAADATGGDPASGGVDLSTASGDTGAGVDGAIDSATSDSTPSDSTALADSGAGGDTDPLAEIDGRSTARAESPPTTTRTPTPAPVPPPVAAPPPPVRRDPEPRRALVGGGGPVVESITWNEGLRGTEVEIRLDGPVRADRVAHDLLGYKATVEQVRILGVSEDYFPATIDVGSASLERVRVGLHDAGGGSELRLVFDFPEPGPAIREVRVDGARILVQVR